MSYIKNLMVVIIASIMGASASSLFVGWSTNELRIVFVVSILMTALITLNSTAQGLLPLTEN